MFPMQGGPAIPWLIAKAIYDTLYAPRYGTTQSLDRLAERGGFGWDEVKLFAAEYPEWKQRQAARGTPT